MTFQHADRSLAAVANFLNVTVKKTLSSLILLVATVIVVWGRMGADSPASAPDQTLAADEVLAAAFANKAEDLQVTGVGEVIKILADDNHGSRHQRFLLEIGNGMTLLVAHNIDLAPRVEGLREGDNIGFHGVYEWNPQGGVIHWTHHDPAGRHVGGWLEHEGRRYE